MSNRKDMLKKPFGISDYSWSSDDDETYTPLLPDFVTQSHSSEPRQSVGERPGTSSVTAPSLPLPSSTSPSVAARRSQVTKQDRDFFWSLLDRPQRVIGRSSRPDVPQPPIGRPVTHTPVPEACGSTEPSSAASDVQRILAFHKLNRSLGACRASRSASDLFSVTRARGNTGRTSNGTSFEASSAALADVQAIFRAKRKRDLARFKHSQQTNRNGGSGSYTSSRAGPSLGEPSTSASTVVEPINIEQSEDETELASTSPPPHATADVINVETSNAEGGTHNTSAVTLEEEIVEIDAEPESGAAAAADVTDTTEGSSDPTPPPTEENANRSEATADAQLQPHGVKRKLDAMEEIEPNSVKEFNQSLLRLLECPVCLEWMEPPMAQCRRGHLVCGRCRDRLNSCPICRMNFSSVRNRAMEGVADMLRYPCRHGCGREVRLRRRVAHESNCPARRYRCVAPACAQRPPLPHSDLAYHVQSKHLSMLKIGIKHKFSIKVNAEHHGNWLIMALFELFHLHIDVNLHTVGIIVYVAYIGPMCNANNYNYEVTVVGQHNSRKLVYTRETHCDLESSDQNVGRQDCFHLTIDQACNFLRFKNRQFEPDRFLNLTVEITKCENEAGNQDAGP